MRISFVHSYPPMLFFDEAGKYRRLPLEQVFRNIQLRGRATLLPVSVTRSHQLGNLKFHAKYNMALGMEVTLSLPDQEPSSIFLETVPWQGRWMNAVLFNKFVFIMKWMVHRPRQVEASCLDGQTQPRRIACATTGSLSSFAYVLIAEVMESMSPPRSPRTAGLQLRIAFHRHRSSGCCQQLADMTGEASLGPAIKGRTGEKRSSCGSILCYLKIRQSNDSVQVLE